MRTPSIVWALATACLALTSVGCERRAEEVLPEPIALSRPAQARPGLEHGQDPRRAADADRPERDRRAVAGDAIDDVEDGGDDDADEGDAEPSRDRARKPAKRRRTGGVASRDDEVAVSSSLRAKRLVVARSVDDREPVGVARSFDASRVSEVSAFVELTNEAREPSRIVVRFEPPASSSFEVPLQVGASPRWRTWASTKRPLESGTWGVRVLDDDGATIARTTFEVVE